ncbi:DMT family transporter [Streptomyces sp. NPDC088817]|uniref:DMT family transporter n=1 Tax=unclassified Streptomyces TaxID=2593676 RepID=UPI0036E279A0
MSALALSVLLSLVSAVAYAGGAIVQERVAVSSPGEQYAPLRRPAWWAALVLNGLGGLLHVVALACGPLSLVQPLGALTIVFALPMASLFVDRRAGAAAWRGAVMATVGLAGLLSLVGDSHTQTLNTAQRAGLAVVTAGVLVAFTVAGRAAHRHPAVRSVLLATGSGIAFGMSSVFTKTVAVDFTDGIAVAELPSLTAIGVLATAGVLLSQASYRGGGLAAPLATLTVVNPVMAAAVGLTLLGEAFRYGAAGTVLALGCGVVAAGGLILLMTERIERTGPVVEAGAASGAATGAMSAGDATGLTAGAISAGDATGLTAGEAPGGGTGPGAGATARPAAGAATGAVSAEEAPPAEEVPPAEGPLAAEGLASVESLPSVGGLPPVEASGGSGRAVPMDAADSIDAVDAVVVPVVPVAPVAREQEDPARGEPQLFLGPFFVGSNSGGQFYANPRVPGPGPERNGSRVRS